MARAAALTAMIVSAALAIVSGAFAAAAVYLPPRLTVDEASLLVMLFAALTVVYGAGAAAAGLVATGRPLPSWATEERALTFASALGFLAVLPVGVMFDFTSNTAAVVLVSVIGGILPVITFLIQERLRSLPAAKTSSS